MSTRAVIYDTGRRISFIHKRTMEIEDYNEFLSAALAAKRKAIVVRFAGNRRKSEDVPFARGRHISRDKIGHNSIDQSIPSNLTGSTPRFINNIHMFVTRGECMINTRR